jgi:beta-glucosidase
MKSRNLLVLVPILCGIVLCMCSCDPKTEAATNARVDSLLRQMTLEEKIGQMTQMCFSTITLNGNKDLGLNPELFKEAVVNYHTGSFLSGTGKAEDWVDFIYQMQKIAVEETRLGIPLIIGIDHVHGANYVDEGTMLPHNLNLSCSFDTSMARVAAEITAVETADLGLQWNFAPVLDVGKNLYWPRLYETFGEDPLVCSLMGVAFIKAYQDPTHSHPYALAACAKHFIGYSDPVSGWDRTPAAIPDQVLYEYHVPSFQQAIDKGVKTIMVNSGEVNGVPVHVSSKLLNDLLREKMGFDGVIVTDIKDISKVYEEHHGAESEKEAVYRSIMAGVDVSMSCNTYHFSRMLKELVDEGRIPESRIDASVRRVLTLKYELGLFDHPYPRKDRLDRIGSSKHDSLAFELAASSLVLLKNENNFLPLQDSPRNLLVTGIGANSKKMLNGAWTLEWEGAEEDRQPARMNTLAQSIALEFPSSNVIIHETSKTGEVEDEAALLNAMKGSDLIVLTLGEQPYSEFKGNISDLTLDTHQLNLAHMAEKSGKPVVFVLMQGRPRLITSIEGFADAVIFAGYPGQRGGDAIAALLSGKVNPSGKLSFSYPKYPAHVIPYYHKHFDKAQNLYDFGHGLSYSDLSYSNLSVNNAAFTSNVEMLTVSVEVTNQSNVPGEEAVLFYFTDEKASITRPVKKLFHFEKIKLEPQESKLVSINVIPQEVFAFPDQDNQWHLEKGSFIISVGDLMQRINNVD